MRCMVRADARENNARRVEGSFHERKASGANAIARAPRLVTCSTLVRFPVVKRCMRGASIVRSGVSVALCFARSRRKTSRTRGECPCVFLLRIAVFLPLGILMLSVFAIAFAIEAMRDAMRISVES